MENPPDEINFRILVVCTGNLHRSPFAEAVLLRRLGELGLTDVAVESAGLAAPEGEACPVEVVQAASEWGVDLSPHRARQVNGLMMREADLILALERFHFTALATAFPVDREKLHLLSIFDQDENPEDIPDPAELDGEGLRAVYRRIALCAAALAEYYAEPLEEEE